MQDNEKKLTHRRYRFALEYISHNYNGTQAAIAAGYSEAGAQEEASFLLSLPAVQETIKELEHNRLEAARLTGEAILNRLMEIVELALSKNDLSNAIRALELLGRNKLWEKGRAGVKQLDGEKIKIIFED